MKPTGLLLRVLAGALVVAGQAAGAGTDVAVPAAATAAAMAARPPASAAATVAEASKPSVSTRAPARAAAVRNAPAPRPEARPTWSELTPQQQQSLAPLAGTWRVLGEAHKRKWLALSENYPAMPPAEQARLHSRMAEWAALSPRQRTLARLNFAESQKVNPDEKRAKWEAYQRLSAEEKRKLAAGAAAAKPPPPPTALAVKPGSQQNFTRIPKPKKPANGARAPAVPAQAATVPPALPPPDQAQPQPPAQPQPTAHP